MVSAIEIIKETRNANKYINGFVEQIIQFTKENIVEQDNKELREEEWNKLKQWLKRNFPTKD